MSAPAEPPKPNRYELPISSMVGAMLVVLAVIAAFVVWRALNRDNQATPIPTVDYHPFAQAGRHDGRLSIFAPPRLPAGWRATSASYTGGTDPHWHLGVLTGDAKYVGIEESLDPLSQLVQQYVDSSASRGLEVLVAGKPWSTWTDAGGDYALARTLKAPKGRFPESVLVVGSAPPAQVRAFVASLR